MNLLNYTKKLYEKITYYDNFIKNTNFTDQKQNPFRKQEENHITIIWVQNEKDI